MKEKKKIDLISLRKAELNEEEMNAVKGGARYFNGKYDCTCTCDGAGEMKGPGYNGGVSNMTS